MADKILIPLSQYAMGQVPALAPLSHTNNDPEEEFKERVGNLNEEAKKFNQQLKDKKQKEEVDKKFQEDINKRKAQLQEQISKSNVFGRKKEEQKQESQLQPRTQEEIKEENSKVAEQTDWLSMSRNRMNQQNERAQKYREEHPIEQAVNRIQEQGIIQGAQAGGAIQNYLKKLDSTQLNIVLTGINAISQYINRHKDRTEDTKQNNGDIFLGGSGWTDEKIQQAEEYEQNAPEIRSVCRRFIYFDKDGLMQSQIICDDGEVKSEEMK